MASTEINDADVEGWASSDAVDRVGKYVCRGRKHHFLTDAGLTANWVVAIERLADDFANPKLREAEDDLKSELTLRKIEPPYELVKEAFEKYCEKAAKLLNALEQDECHRMHAEIDADISAFKSGRDRSQN